MADKEINFGDSIVSIANDLVNTRNGISSNKFSNEHVDDVELTNMYNSGIGGKFVNLKASYSLSDTIKFDNKSDAKKYRKKLSRKVLKATKSMLTYGRGIIVLWYPDEVDGDYLSKELKLRENKEPMCKAISGDVVFNGFEASNKAMFNFVSKGHYIVNGVPVHKSRVIDFVSEGISERENMQAGFRGVSELKRIYPQVMVYEVIHRAIATIIERGSTVYYKISDLRDAISEGAEEVIKGYVRTAENMRSIYGAGIVDAEDDVVSVSQVVSNLSEAENIAVRALSLVTSMPPSILIGETVGGLNSTGDEERNAFQDSIETFQDDLLIEPISRLCTIYGINNIEFKENQLESATSRLNFETKAIDNAVKLNAMGEDGYAYLVDKGVMEKRNFDGLFPEL